MIVFFFSKFELLGSKCDNVLFNLKKITEVSLASISLEDGEQGSSTGLGSNVSSNDLLELFELLLQLGDVSLHPGVLRQ